MTEFELSNHRKKNRLKRSYDEKGFNNLVQTHPKHFLHNYYVDLSTSKIHTDLVFNQNSWKRYQNDRNFVSKLVQKESTQKELRGENIYRFSEALFMNTSFHNSSN
jgi:hypothetical protein